MAAATYFLNHARRGRFPWSLYHRELERRLGDAVRRFGPGARVLIVGCGLEPFVPGVDGVECFGVDLDEAAIAACRVQHPELAARLAVCPGPYELPRSAPFDQPFDVVLAKEVIEHVPEPERWALGLAQRLRIGGELLLTTPNYGRFSTLALLERSVLEWIARRDGYSRRHIHPSRFDRHRLARLGIELGLEPLELRVSSTGWALFGRWRRTR